MNRQTYFNFIESKLSQLATSIAIRGGLNILDLNLHAENFYLHFLNKLFKYTFENLNVKEKNAAGIDLVDTANHIIAQVTATATKRKVESALTKDLSKYKGYSFKFIAISKNIGDLRTKTFKNPHNLIFLPADDIFDIKSLLALINSMEIERIKEIYEFIKKELKNEPDPEKVESNLASIIKILSKENWSHVALNIETVPFNIRAKISYNQLDSARALIEDYTIHHHRIDKIYSDFDRQGANKSFSILNGIRSEYLALDSVGTPDQYFFKIIQKIVKKIRGSANYTSIPDEELELCVQILVVDAFIRCKIFKNPIGNTNANS